MISKKVMYYGIAALLAVAACKKESSQVGQLSLSSTKSAAIKRGEPVIFTMNGVTGSTVHWSVNPDSSVQINTSGNTASISFGRPGSYTVAGSSGTQIDSVLVEVEDSIFTGDPGNSYTLDSLKNDELTVTPLRMESADSSGLILAITTGRSYNCLNSFLQADNTSSAAGFHIQVAGVRQPGSGGCTPGQAKVTGFTALYPLIEGTQSFTITLNHVDYTGSIMKSGNQYSISWPYSTGVKFSKLVLD